MEIHAAQLTRSYSRIHFLILIYDREKDHVPMWGSVSMFGKDWTSLVDRHNAVDHTATPTIDDHCQRMNEPTEMDAK